jgi:hypothetical protein
VISLRARGDIQKILRAYNECLRSCRKNGRASDLEKELDALFNSQNTSPDKAATSIPATFLRVTIAV